MDGRCKEIETQEKKHKGKRDFIYGIRTCCLHTPPAMRVLSLRRYFFDKIRSEFDSCWLEGREGGLEEKKRDAV